ncbi:MAG: hypothetical protein HY291_02055 [Planctomycetes bacterium]|nr:hypothetical protein [Planctomycetota bacterium]
MHEVKSLHAGTFTLCGLLLLGANFIRAAETPEKPAEKPAEKPVAELLLKLMSDDEAERAEARKALVLKGDAIKAEVQKALDGAGQDADYSAQLKEIIKDLGQNEMLRGFDAPQTIDLELKDATVKDALAKLKETFGFTVNASDAAASKKVELNRKGLTFFEALDSIREAAKLGYRIDQALQATPENAKTVAVSLDELGEKGWVAAAPAGPFLIVVQSVNTFGNKSMDMNGGSNEHKQMNMQVMAIPQPGLVLGGVQPEETKFTDSKNNSFNGQHQQARIRNFGFRGQRLASGSAPIYLNDGIQMSAEIVPPLAWEASMKVQIPLKMLAKTLENLAAGNSAVETTDGQVSVGKPEQSGQQWKLKITFPQNSELAQGGWGGGMAIMAKAGVGAAGGNDNKPPKGQPGYFVLNSEGNVIQSMGMSGSGNGRTMTYDLTFGEEPKSVLLQWNGERTERTVKFKVPSIPMP